MNLDRLRKKRIAVLGFSIEGLSVARFLERHGFNFTILEKNETDKLLPQAREFLLSRNYPIITGPTHLNNLNRFDLISRSQGIPLWNPEITEARMKGSEITSMTKLFFDFCPCKIIGVTGTKGKGTTSSLIYEMMKSSGLDVYLGGNIGKAPLDFIDDLRGSSWAVLELSSFQLEDLTKSPHIAVVLMVTQEHLNSQAEDSPNYHLSINDYLESKKNILRFQSEGDFAVINKDFHNSVSLVKGIKSRAVFFSTKEGLAEGSYLKGDKFLICFDKNCRVISGKEEVFLRGEHNWQNILAASAAASLAGASFPAIQSVVRTFKGLEHRLEFAREVNGVRYYNDSFSTTPETAIAAIKSFNESEVLILGGSDKGSDYSQLGKTIAGAENIRAVILIGVTSGKIKKAIESGEKGKSLKIIEGLSLMREIVEKASQMGLKGDVVLLSPACASFDMFKNYKDRGLQFKEWVSKL